MNDGVPDLSQATHAEGVPHKGGEALTVEHGGTGTANHPDPSVFGLDATVWVSIAMAVFLVIVAVKGGAAAVGNMLDRQIGGIKRRLDEAKQLRAEAEALRKEYARKIADVEAQTATMIVHAAEEAKALVAKAEVDAAELVQRRTRMAEDRIGAAERSAIAEVRAKAADAATQAAATLIAQKLDGEHDRPLVDRTIAGLGRLN